MIRRIQQGLLAEGVAVSIAKLCTWFGIPRRTVYYKPVKAAPKVVHRAAAAGLTANQFVSLPDQLAMASGHRLFLCRKAPLLVTLMPHSGWGEGHLDPSACPYHPQIAPSGLVCRNRCLMVTPGKSVPPERQFGPVDDRS